MTEHFLEEYQVGQTYSSSVARVESGRIRSFAAEFDPQPFHLSEEGAAGTVFGSLAASGWHTAAMTMRLVVEGTLRPAGGVVGLGFDEFRWPSPVRPGDELHAETEIVEVRSSKSRPGHGVIKVRITTRNQHGLPVQIAVGHLLVPREDREDAKEADPE
jgi:acyl dehydratase